MSYYADAITNLDYSVRDRCVFVAGRCASRDCVQCYVAGRLVDWQQPGNGGYVEFAVGSLLPTEPVLLLAVDPDDAETDYYDEAFPLSSHHGNRIRIESRTASANLATDRWRVYLGGAGEASAETKVREADVFPGGRYAGGWGSMWGYYYGHGAYGAGFGYTWGHEWGYGSLARQYVSDAKTPGDYPVKVTATDKVGNESAAAEDVVILETYPSPAADLSITSYTQGTDTLVLSFTASGDV